MLQQIHGNASDFTRFMMLLTITSTKGIIPVTSMGNTSSLPL